MTHPATKPVHVRFPFVGRDRARAQIFVRGVLTVQAYGRNEECALADAVAQFRTTRTVRAAKAGR